MSRQAGFTLIEMMVVLLLLGVGFGYTIINIDFLVPNASLEKAARDLGGTLTRLRGLAVFRGRPYQLEYDLDAHKYRVIRPTSKAEQEEGLPEYIETDWFELPSEVSFENLQFNQQDVLTNSSRLIEFTPMGGVEGHLIHLISAKIPPDEQDRNRYTIELNPITGLVSYQPGLKEYAQVRDEFEFR